jgi:hypothetical protein
MAQFMISVPDTTRDRLDALRIVLATSRANIGRTAIEDGGLAKLEKLHKERLARLVEVARDRGYPNWNGLVRDVIDSAAGAHGRAQKLPTLEELEDPQIPTPRRERSARPEPRNGSKREPGSTSGVIPTAFIAPRT